MLACREEEGGIIIQKKIENTDGCWRVTHTHTELSFCLGK